MLMSFSFSWAVLFVLGLPNVWFSLHHRRWRREPLANIVPSFGISYYFCGLSLYIWYYYATTEGVQPDSCQYSVFLFGRRHINAHFITFFRRFSITWASTSLLNIPILLEAFLHTKAIQRIRSNLVQRWPDYLPKKLHSLSILLTPPRVLKELEKLFPDSRALRLLSLILSGKILQPREPQEARIIKIFAIMMLTWTSIQLFASMVCFVVFVEKTIVIADVKGVYEVLSTGQLIPLVTGLISFFMAGTRFIKSFKSLET